MTSTDRQVPYFGFTIRGFNPNHQVRFLALAPIRFLFDLSTAVGDDSFYLVPKLAREASVQAPGASGGTVTSTVKPVGNDHLSFHESGEVNLHIGGTRRTLRPGGGGRGPNGLAVRILFNTLTLFEGASHEDVNNLPKRYTQVPVMGLWEQYPVCLDIYQVAREAEWVMPTLGEVVQAHVCVQPDRKQSDYHFLVWQHTRAERHPADVAVLYSPIL